MADSIASPEPDDLVDNAPQFEKLTMPSADNWRFELNRVEFPVLLVWMLCGLYGGYVCLTCAKLPTLLFTFFTVILGTIGMWAGGHRLWSHRAYKVKPQLECLLVILYMLNNQRPILTWARTHRLHHLCSETDGDPHNATRGFFFTHFGWLIYKPHPQVLKRRDYIDVSDLTNNPIIRFQQRYYLLLILIFSYAIPVSIPLLWGESLFVSLMSSIFRMNITLQMMLSINSFTHLMGYKPIDRTVVGTQTRLMGLLTGGEGFHNYHHAFPYDYRSSELGDVKYNISALFIELMEKIGWAYDLKVTSEEAIKNRVLKKGDGTDMFYIPNNKNRQKFHNAQFYKGFYDKLD